MTNRECKAQGCCDSGPDRMAKIEELVLGRVGAVGSTAEPSEMVREVGRELCLNSGSPVQEAILDLVEKGKLGVTLDWKIRRLPDPAPAKAKDGCSNCDQCGRCGAYNRDTADELDRAVALLREAGHYVMVLSPEKRSDWEERRRLFMLAYLK